MPAPVASTRALVCFFGAIMYLALEQISLLYLALKILNFLIWHRVKIFFCKWLYRPFLSVDRVNPVMFLSEVPKCPFSSLTLLRSVQTLFDTASVLSTVVDWQ